MSGAGHFAARLWVRAGRRRANWFPPSCVRGGREGMRRRGPGGVVCAHAMRETQGGSLRGQKWGWAGGGGTGQTRPRSFERRPVVHTTSRGGDKHKKEVWVLGGDAQQKKRGAEWKRSAVCRHICAVRVCKGAGACNCGGRRRRDKARRENKEGGWWAPHQSGPRPSSIYVCVWVEDRGRGKRTSHNSFG